MTYPLAPDERMPYDRDGTYGYYYSSGGPITQIPTPGLQALNSENPNAGIGFSSGGYGSYPIDTGSESQNGVTFIVGLIFPELRNISGLFMTQWGYTWNAGSIHLFTSVDTTDGQDGTWIDQGTSGVIYTNVNFPDSSKNPNYRQDIASYSLTGIKAVRFFFPNQPFYPYEWQISSIELYGRPSSGQNLDSLRVWQPVTNAEVAGPLDFGDVFQGSSYNLTFRVKNLSSSYIAESPITLSVETLYDASVSIVPQFQLSTDGVNYFSTITISSLAPGAISPVLYVKDVVASNAVLGAWAARIVIVPSAWG